MYSMVLMAALTTGVDMPDLGRRGGSCNGCNGGGYGCNGGGYGCNGGCYGRNGGCYGCNGGCYGCNGGCYGCNGGRRAGRRHGCSGGCTGVVSHGCCGGCSGVVYNGCCGGTMIMQVRPAPEKAPAPTEKKSELTVPAPATLVIDLPADAKLRIDDTATTSTGANRVFQSPTLELGKVYQYTIRAEVVREGKAVKMEQIVEVKAGQTKPVVLSLPTTGVAQ